MYKIDKIIWNVRILCWALANWALHILLPTEGWINMNKLYYRYGKSPWVDKITWPPCRWLMQERCHSSVLAMELQFSCTNPLMLFPQCDFWNWWGSIFILKLMPKIITFSWMIKYTDIFFKERPKLLAIPMQLISKRVIDSVNTNMLFYLYKHFNHTWTIPSLW